MAGVSASRDDACNDAGAHRLVALANGEARLLLDCDRLHQLDRELGVVTRHHHLSSVLERDGSGDVGGPEVELRAVVAGERLVTSAFVLGQHIDLSLELPVRRERARPRQHLSRSTMVRSMPRSRQPTLSPASPWSSTLRWVSTLVTIVRSVSARP